MSGNQTVQMAYDEMLLEAYRWREAAKQMADARDVVRNLTLTADDFSGAAETVGLVEVYEDLRARMETLMGQGAERFLASGQSLQKVVERGQHTEAEAEKRLERVSQYLEEQGL